MRDVTPKALRCTFGGCPAIIEVTPQDMRCGVMASCPAIYEQEQEDGHYIIGKIVAPERIPEEIRQRIGPDEQLIWTPKGLVKPGDA
jgi:hypothetical protein